MSGGRLRAEALPRGPGAGAVAAAAAAVGPAAALWYEFRQARISRTVSAASILRTALTVPAGVVAAGGRRGWSPWVVVALLWCQAERSAMARQVRVRCDEP